MEDLIQNYHKKIKRKHILRCLFKEEGNINKQAVIFYITLGTIHLTLLLHSLHTFQGAGPPQIHLPGQMSLT